MGNNKEPQPIQNTRDALRPLLDFKMTAKGHKREDGLKAAEVRKEYEHGAEH